MPIWAMVRCTEQMPVFCGVYTTSLRQRKYSEFGLKGSHSIFGGVYDHYDAALNEGIEYFIIPQNE